MGKNKRTPEGRIYDLKKKCTGYRDSLELAKYEIRQHEKYTQMLLKEGRTTKEELMQYFKSKKKIREEIAIKRTNEGNT